MPISRSRPEAGVKEVRLRGISVSNLDLAPEEKSDPKILLELGFKHRLIRFLAELDRSELLEEIVLKRDIP